ncbi:cytosine permease [Kutzneria sp. 744]|uniref:cytosine permease n=1 Tax=Kutzneria sp. (strain 744) TaxID=345341 RepID=UPI0003EECFF6|nr:cytosine permease [Kutzneria sp. 744]EWM10565.1 permease [Kutzneria sp. 744]
MTTQDRIIPGTDDYSISRMPDHARRSWFGVAVQRLGQISSFSQFLIGSALGFGMTFWDAVLAMALGVAMLEVVTVLLGMAGAREGLSMSMLSRWGGFGRKGSALVGLLLTVSLTGWFGVQSGAFAEGLHSIAGGPPTWVWALAGGVVVALIATGGFVSMAWTAYVTVPAFVLLAGYCVLRYLGEHSLAELTSGPPPGPAMTIAQGATIVAGGFIMGAIMTPDLTRFNRSPGDVVKQTVLAVTLGECGAGVIGILLAHAAKSSDIVGIVTSSSGVIGTLILVAAIVKVNDVNLYCASLGLVNAVDALSRKRIRRVSAALGLGLAGSVLSALGILDHFTSFLTVLGVITPPVAGVFVAEYYLVRRWRPGLDESRAKGELPAQTPDWEPRGLIAWAAGAAVGLTVDFGIPSLNSILVTFVLYLLLARRSRPRAADEEAHNSAPAPATTTVVEFRVDGRTEGGCFPMRRRPVHVLLVCCLSASVGFVAASPARAADDPEIGTDGWVHVEPNGVVLGRDPYYPKDGNGGYTVADYKVDISYDPACKKLVGKAVITAKTLQQLKQFNLDLQGLQVSSVKVNGADATFSRADEHELVIVPATALDKGVALTVEVAYSGAPSSIDTPQGKTGWQALPDGGAVAVGRPHSARTWFPLNDTQMARATFDLTATVPSGWSVVSIGNQQPSTTADGRTTFHWKETTSAPPQSIAIGIDRYQFEESKLADGTPVVNAFAPGGNHELAAMLPEVMDFLKATFGNYPEDALGGVFLPSAIGSTTPAQGRPFYGGDADLNTLIHAMAYQWWGNALTIKMWKDFCMADCFAQYATWLWDAKHGADLDARYRQIVESNRDRPELWATNLEDPGAGKEFTAADKGLLFVHALRERVGEDNFAKLLVNYVKINKNWWNQGWYDWELYAKAATQQNLDDFFAAWLHSAKIPEDKFLYPAE